ncbi:MAG TPA: hypothetical protein VFK11_02910 [Candidatus Saccharimonadales bacterium]|nr:hypothetical protein [Candidatus Saccharimonadales bacterium]
MAGDGIEKRVLNLVGETAELLRFAWDSIVNPRDESVLQAGLPEPKTFATSIEEGGKSRFLPALAIAVSAVSPDKGVEPRDAFDDFIDVLDKRGRPLARSDKPRSTGNTIKALYAEDEHENPQYMEGVSITQCATGIHHTEEAINDIYTPTRNDRSVLLMPFDPKIFNESVFLPEESNVPLWGVAFGAYKPAHTEEKKSATEDDEAEEIRRMAMTPVSTLVRVAFPVPPTLTGNEEKGSITDIPMIKMMHLFLRDEIVPGVPNTAYIVSEQQRAA